MTSESQPQGVSRAEASGGDLFKVGRTESRLGMEGTDADAAPPLPAPPLQASAPGSSVDYSLHDLVLHTNYTATVRGLRGPNLTSPASITFTTGTAYEMCGMVEGELKRTRMGSIFSSHLPLPGLEAPRDLEAQEVTPRTALLTWTEPQVPPTGYLLSFHTPGGQIQVPQPLPYWPTPLPGIHSRRHCLCLFRWGSPSLSPDLSLVRPTGDPAPRRHHLSPAPGPLSLHPLQRMAPGHVGREPHAARVHLFHHWYSGGGT